MAENFANVYQTTLAADLTASATTLTVASAAGAPAPQFRLLIDSELVLVTATAGVTYTVTRGVEGTVAANHTASAAVAHVVTAGALAQLRADAPHTIQDEGVALPARGALNFVGPALTVTDDSVGNRSVVTLPTATAAVEGSFAPADKAKLDGVAAGAQVNVLEGVDATAPVTVSALAAKRQTVGIVAATTAAPGSMSAADKTKLDGIASGAQVNVLEGVTGTAPIVAGAVNGKSQALSISAATGSAAGSMSAADKTKLDGYPAQSALVLNTVLTNGGLEVWQRGAGPFTATGAYTADRWQLQLGTGGTASVAKDTTNYAAGSGACASIAYTHGTAVSALIQPLEDYAQLRGRTLALSARIRGTVANGARVRLSDGTTNWYSGYHSGGGAYETLSVVATIPAGATSVNAALELAASGTYYLDNVMLVAGNQPQDYVPLTPADDLARCQRYYETLGVDGGGDILIAGYQVTSGVIYDSLAYKQTKALTPTVTKLGVWSLTNSNTQPAISNVSVLGFWTYITVTSAGAASAQNNTSGSYITVEANP